MKKRLLSLLTLLIFSSSIFLLVGCDDGGSDNTHVHTFNPNWTMSETEHWHDATCGCDIRGELGSHEFDRGTIQKEPTEYQEGVKIYRCLTCGSTKEEILPALGHQHKFSPRYSSNEETHWFACECGEKNNEEYHTWDSGVVLSEPQVGAPGKTMYTCVVCSYQMFENTVLEHSCAHDHYTYTDQFHWSNCSCGAELSMEYHRWDDGTVVYESTETDHGLMVYMCLDCHHTIEEQMPLLPHTHVYSEEWTYSEYYHWHDAICGHEGISEGLEPHTFDEGVVTVEPTVEHNGEKVYTCFCGYSYTETIPQHYHTTAEEYGHDDNGHWIVYTCDCDMPIDIQEHNYWLKEVVDSTVDEEGLKTYECMVCYHIKTEIIPVHQHSYVTAYWTKDDTHHWREVACGCDIEPTKIEHNYTEEEIYRQPTCSEPGRATLYCECGKYIDSEVAATGNHNLIVSGVEWSIDNLSARELLTCGCGYQEYTEYVDSVVSIIEEKVFCTDEEVTKYTVELSTTYEKEIVTKEATSHDLEECIGHPVSCDSIGWDPYVTCNLCSYTTYEEIPATGHNTERIVVEATCYDRGYEYDICLNGCGYVSSHMSETNPLGHKLQYFEPKAPTCDEDGYYGHYECIRCGYTDTNYDREATGHLIDPSVFGEEEIYGLVYKVTTDDFAPMTNGIKADNLRTTSVLFYEFTAEIDVTIDLRMQYNVWQGDRGYGYHFNIHFNEDTFNETTLSNPDFTTSTMHNIMYEGGWSPTNWDTCKIILEKGDKVTFVFFFDNLFSNTSVNKALYSHTEFRIEMSVLPYDYLPANQFDTMKVYERDIDKIEPLCNTDIYCLTCEKLLVEKLGHDWVEYEGLEPTCLTDGYKPYHVCNSCGETTYEYLPLSEHEYEDDYCTGCGIHRPTEGIIYTLVEDGSGYKVTGFDPDSSATEIYFDNHYNNKPVLYIDEFAFQNNNKIIKIVVPETVKVKTSAFYGCSSLVDVILYGEVEQAPFPYTNIENVTCTLAAISKMNYKLPQTVESLTLLDGEDIVYSDLNYLVNLKTLTLPASVKSIGKGTFSYLEQLEKVDYLGTMEDYIQIDFYGYSSVPSFKTKTLYIKGELVTSFDNTDFTCATINDYAFYNLESLTSFTLGQPTTIGINSLAKTKITTLGIGATVTEFNKVLFESQNIETISLDPNNNTYRLSEDGSLFLKDENTLVLASKNLTSIDGISKITEYSFIFANNEMETLTITEDMTIESGAFTGLNHIVTVNLYSLETVDGDERSYALSQFFRVRFRFIDGEYYYYESSTSAIIPQTLEVINVLGTAAIRESAFSGLSMVSEINLLGTTTRIEEYAFENCAGLTSFVVPDHVTYIGKGAFSGCYNIESITLPFTGQTKWDNQTTPTENNLGYIFGPMKTNSSMVEGKYYSLPAALKEVTVTSDKVKAYAFAGCYDIETIELTGDVITIDEYAFWQTTSLSSLNIPTTVENIYNYAFNETGLTTVVIPASVEFIGYNIFQNSTNLKSVVILSEQIQIGRYMFAGCTSLESVTYPTTLTTIEYYAFAGCTSLSLEDVVADSITTISSHAFDSCTQIEVVNIPNASFGIGAFANCINIKEIHFGTAQAPAYLFSTVETEGTYPVTLTGTTHYVPNTLEKVTYQQGSLGKGSFSGLKTLKVLDCGNVSYFSQGAFTGLSNLEVLTIPYVGCESTSMYYSALFGNMFGTTSYENSVEITQCYKGTDYLTYYIPLSLKVLNITNPTALQYHSLSNLQLEEININVENLEYIDGTAFINTTGVKYTNYNNGVYFGSTSNPYQMLVSVSDNTVTSFEIHEDCTVIMDNAFAGCAELTSVVIPASVTKIGASAFSGCKSLAQMTLPFVGASKDATAEKALLGYIFGESQAEGMTAITQYYSATEAKTYYLPTTLTTLTLNCEELKYGALYGCSSITSITFNGLTTIAEKSLALTGVVSLNVPTTVQSIGEGAFAGMINLESIVLPFVGARRMNHEADTASNESLFGYVFGTEKLAASYLATINQKYQLGNTYYKCYVPSRLKDITILEGDLFFGAFYGMNNYYATHNQGSKVTLGENVTYIGDYAFAYCLYMKDEHMGIDGRNYGLTDLIINGDLEYLGSNLLNYSYFVLNITFNGDLSNLEYSEDVFNGHNPTEHLFVNPTITFKNQTSNVEFYNFVLTKYSE